MENSGDLPRFSDPVAISYWNVVYFIMVTMSTGMMLYKSVKVVKILLVLNLNEWMGYKWITFFGLRSYIRANHSEAIFKIFKLKFKLKFNWFLVLWGKKSLFIYLFYAEINAKAGNFSWLWWHNLLYLDGQGCTTYGSCRRFGKLTLVPHTSVYTLLKLTNI